MFGLFNEPRNWKWMLPGFLVFPCVFWWNDWVMAGGAWEELAIIPGGLAIILGLSSLINLVLYAYHHWALEYADVQAARNNTPEVRMFEAAKGMHPDAVHALLQHRRSIWRIKYVPMKDVVDWIFDEIPSVHAGFVDFVLDHSSSAALMSKRLLSDGSKKFDPEGIVTDYQQYDDLILYMQVKLMLTQALGNQSPQWLPPWNPETARHWFGLDGTPYAVEEEGVSDAMQAVLRAQAKWQKNGKLQNLAETEPTQAQKPFNGNGKPKVDQREAELSEEQLAAIEEENMKYEQMLKGDTQ